MLSLVSDSTKLGEAVDGSKLRYEITLDRTWDALRRLG